MRSNMNFYQLMSLAASASHYTISFINGTITFLRLRWLKWGPTWLFGHVMSCHWCQCQCTWNWWHHKRHHCIPKVKAMKMRYNMTFWSCDTIASSVSIMLFWCMHVLCTKIPHEEGIRAKQETLTIYRKPTEVDHTSYITGLLRIVLETNHSDLNGRHFYHIASTVMDTKLAPSSANLLMSNFQDKYVFTYWQQPFIWKRFIGNLFQIWTYSIEELDNFINYLNSCHPTIKFTQEVSTTQVHFWTCLYINQQLNYTYGFMLSPHIDIHILSMTLNNQRTLGTQYAIHNFWCLSQSIMNHIT